MSVTQTCATDSGQSDLAQYVTVDAAAIILSCSPKTVRRAISRRELRAVRVGNARSVRIARSDLASFLRPTSKAEALDDYVQRVVESAPSLNAAQRRKLSVLLGDATTPLSEAGHVA